MIQLVPLSPVQPAYVIEGGEINAVRLFAVRIDPVTLDASYVGSYSESVGAIRLFSPETVTWSEGAALNRRALRQRAERSAREQTTQQCDDAIAFIEGL